MEKRVYADHGTPRRILIDRTRPLRVLTMAGVGSSYQQYCRRDIEEGLRCAGGDARLLVVRAHPLMHFEVLEQISEFEPNVLLLNGRGRFHFMALPPSLCVVTWDQDHAVAHSSNHAKAMGARDRLLVMVCEWQEDAKAAGVPREKRSQLNLGTNPRIYHPPAQLVNPTYKVLFVGNIYPWRSYRQVVQFDQLDSLMQQLPLDARDRLRQWVLDRGEDEPFVLPKMGSFLIEPARRGGLTRLDDEIFRRGYVHFFRYRIAHMVLRELYVTALSDFKLGLFGLGWDAIAPVAPQAQAPIVNGPRLREAIHCSALNLHLHTWTVHHPRLYDTAPWAGRCWSAGSPSSFRWNRCLTRIMRSTRSARSPRRKIRHYLDHPDRRAQMDNPELTNYTDGLAVNGRRVGIAAIVGRIEQMG